MTDEITFKKVTSHHQEALFSWLAEPHVQEFWDNTPEHKEDIVNWMSGRKTPSSYCGGKYVYWIAYANQEPYAMIMTIQETLEEDIGELKKSHLSKTGNTYGIDFMIGNPSYLGQGYAANTLIAFIDFFRKEFDPKADTFIIDPAVDNPRAKHVYEKAGFTYIADFILGDGYSGSGKAHSLLIKKCIPIITVVSATTNEYPLIKDMSTIYFDELSKACGHTIDTCILKQYLNDRSRRALLIKVYDNIAGFALLNQANTCKNTDWNMAEFFILEQFRRLGIGIMAANKIWQQYPGKWEVSVVPENKSAIIFWESILNKLTNAHFSKETKRIDFDQKQPKRIIFSFEI